MTNDEMKTMLEAILEAQQENARVRAQQRPVAQLAKPASPPELARLEAHLARLGLKLPPSFRQFLSITNGIDGFMQDDSLSMRSTGDIEERFHGKVAGHIADKSAWADFAPLCNFVVASGATSAFVAFDPDTEEGGEMDVVMVTEDGGRVEFGSFEEFLEEQLTYQTDVLAAYHADHANLADD